MHVKCKISVSEPTYKELGYIHTYWTRFKSVNLKWEYFGAGLNHKIFCISTFHHSPRIHISRNLTFKQAACSLIGLPTFFCHLFLLFTVVTAILQYSGIFQYS